MLGVTAMFLFEPIWSKTNLVFEVWSDSEILAKKLLVKVHRQLDLSTRNCRPCRETVRVYDDNKMEQADIEKIPEKFSMYLLFETTKECQEAIIVARMSRLIGRELKLKFGREHITMMVSAASYEAYDFYQYKAGGKEIFLTHSYPCRTFHYADFQQLGRCPSVSLNITDYLHLMQMTNEASGERDINSLFGLTHIGDKIAGETENFTAQVCYKSYQSILKAKNHGITMLNIKVALVAMGLISTIFWA